MPIFEEDEIGIVPDVSYANVSVPDVKGRPHTYRVNLPGSISRNFQACIRLFRQLSGGSGGSVIFGILTTDLEQGGTATFNPIIWDGAAWVLDEDTEETVHDVMQNTGESWLTGTVIKADSYYHMWVASSAYCSINDVFI